MKKIAMPDPARPAQQGAARVNPILAEAMEAAGLDPFDPVPFELVDEYVVEQLQQQGTISGKY